MFNLQSYPLLMAWQTILSNENLIFFLKLSISDAASPFIVYQLIQYTSTAMAICQATKIRGGSSNFKLTSHLCISSCIRCISHQNWCRLYVLRNHFIWVYPMRLYALHLFARVHVIWIDAVNRLYTLLTPCDGSCFLDLPFFCELIRWFYRMIFSKIESYPDDWNSCANQMILSGVHV